MHPRTFGTVVLLASTLFALTGCDEKAASTGTAQSVASGNALAHQTTTPVATVRPTASTVTTPAGQASTSTTSPAAMASTTTVSSANTGSSGQTSAANSAAYALYSPPTADELNDPTLIKVYNFTSQGITAINGSTPDQGVIPPGKTGTLTKRDSDLDDPDSPSTYTLSIDTDGGQSGSADFDPSAVDQDSWRANVTLTSGVLNIQQIAGGGGGGGGGGGSGGNGLKNFTDS